MGSWSLLNPEATEFLPSKICLVSAPTNYLMFPPPINYPSCLHPLAFLEHPPFFSHYSFQHAQQAHFLVAEKAAAVLPETEPATVSFLMEPFETKMVLLGEAQEAASAAVAPKGNVGGSSSTVRRSKNNCQYHMSTTQARKKTWRPAPNPSSCSSTGNNQSFGCNNNINAGPRKILAGMKHPPIPLTSDGNETTVMIRNVPNRLTREKLKDILDQHCMLTNRSEPADNSFISAFDFLYLPIDFITGSNKGYAFVNFTKAEAARKLYDAWHDTYWHCFHSYKIRQICCAKLQGMQQLMKQYERVEFPSEDFQPLIFHPARDGSREPVKETLVGRCTVAS